MRNALLLGGGGSRGAIEAGFYKALFEMGAPVDMIFGTSVGALNGAFIAAGFAPEQLEAIWNQLEEERLFRRDWSFLWKWGRADGLYQADGLIDFLKSTLPVKRFEQLKVPLVVTATDLTTSEPVYLDSGELLPALLASAAMPPYLPPVAHQGRHLVDGGFVANVPIGEAIARGAQCVLAMLCHCAGELIQVPRGFLEVQGRALRIALEQKFRHDLEHYKDKARMIVLEPCFDFPLAMLKIQQTSLLIEQGYQFAKTELLRRMPDHFQDHPGGE
ncbi:MAG: patatin-like phospholipase family protein [Candidatus Omnitrophica bacterium]|nr:patatin-like phospholipase family protein [Candidatus Omnitrophota bacterium]